MRKLAFVVAALLIPGAATAQDSLMETACFDGHSYELWRTEGPISWSDARSRATYLGAQLVTIASVAENGFVTELAARYDQFDETGAIPLSGSDSEQDGTWIWTTGEPMQFSAWRRGEPNGGARENAIELCVRRKCRAGSWNDISDNLRFRHFVVEYPDSGC